MPAFSVRALDAVAPGHHRRWVHRGIVFVLWAYAIVTIIDMVTHRAVRWENLAQFGVLAVSLAALRVCEGGRASLASSMVIGAIWFDIILNMGIGGRVMGGGAPVIPALATAAVLLGTRASLRFAVATSLVILPVASIRGLLGMGPYPDVDEIVAAVILAAVTIGIAALARWTMETFGQVLSAARRQGEVEERVAQLGRIVDDALNEIYVFDAATLKLQLVNRGARENLRYSAAELSRMTMADVNPTFRDVGADALRTVREGDDERPRLRGVHRRKDGSAYPVEMALEVGRVGEDATIIAFAEDITDRERAEAGQRHLEQQLLHSQKMEAVGHLAGGVAHDFNNLLTVIGGYGELLAAADDPYTRDLAGEIVRAQQRGTALTRKLLAFARKEIRDPRPLRLAGVVGELEIMLVRMLGRGYRLDLRTEGDGWIVGDLSQVEQILLNLVANSRDAMPGGGTVTVTVGEIRSDDDPSATGLVRLTVVDEGVGMGDEVRERVFEPFFTTKPRGKGTGLGLSAVHGIVSQSGGRVEIESSPGKGCAVHVLLPAAPPELLSELETENERSESPTDGTILVAEDEEGTRTLVVRMLERAGYRVRAVSSAESALDALDADPTAISMLLTDVVMPGMSGIDLAREVRRRHPNLGILLMSGYVDDRLNPGNELDPSRNLILKPFSGQDLRQRVARVLAER